MLTILRSLQAAPRYACTAAGTTFSAALLQATRGYSNDAASSAFEKGGKGAKTGLPTLDDVNLDVDDFALEKLIQQVKASPNKSVSEDLFEEEREREDLVVKYLSEDNMSRKELVHEEMTRVRENFKLHDYDTGSTPVQVALLTVKIKALTQHLTKHRKDEPSKRGLKGMLSQRKRLLKYIRKKDPEVYQDIILRLGLKDRTYVGSKYTE
jgi:small subunit ribosomal protein S15